MMLENKKIVFEKPWEARLKSEPLDDGSPVPGHVIVKKRYSLISAGTELACLSGGESWFRMPGVPGYCCVAEIVKAAPDVKDFAPGDTVFCYGNHSLYEVLPREGIFLHVPPGIDPKWVPFVRMASIAATAIRASDIEWGDTAAVTGQGLVGNMAMQLAKLQGAAVIAVDVIDSRLAISRTCGADLVINSAREDAAGEIRRFTDGAMVSTMIDATGVPAVAARAAEWVGQNGELVFLGSPRGTYVADFTPFFNRVHLAPFNVILKGAHEWRYPVNRTPFVKHSLERNSRLIMDLIFRKKLSVEPLLSEIVSPSDCFDVYNNIRNYKDRYMGVLFEWK
ncbi:MAG: zinc-binding alcohol dehydrogenase [Treponema sp.]|jgi:2-desacetyl-2-hydroxyethyl bacteriochlorophyllide A dehydrogenase|nr:zinc-binding alcohol dehydrogenase [Treponema sp.]